MTIIDFYQNNTFLSLIWLTTLALLIFNLIKIKNAKFKEIEKNEVIRLLNNENGVVFDIRSAKDFKSGHITGAQNVAASDIKNDNLKNLEKYKTVPVIVVCPAGFLAQPQANLLHALGYENIYTLKGGMTNWQDAHLPTVKN